MSNELRRGFTMLAQAAVLGLVFLFGRGADEGGIVSNATSVLGFFGVVLAAVALLFIIRGLRSTD